jgi:hypothetical protein
MWNPFRRNKKKKITLDTEVAIINNQVKSMLEACYEYAGWTDEIDEIYIFLSLEEGLFPKWFYRINSQIVKAHEINDHLTNSYDTSTERQFGVLQILSDDLVAIDDGYELAKKEIPTRIKITFNPQTNQFNIDLEYTKELIGTDRTNHDLLDRWMAELA